jgi:hypothetical protein
MPDLAAEFDRLPWCPGYPAPGSSWCMRRPIHEGHRWSAFDRDAAALRGDWARVGAHWTAALTSTVAGPLPDIEDWENGDVIVTLKRLPWWRRIWRRRG